MDVPPRKRLTREQWIEAGLEALLEAGPSAVAVEPVAARLGVTKGSGYWHFVGRAQFLEAVMEQWVTSCTHAVVENVEAAGGSPQARMSRLLDMVTAAAERTPAEWLVTASTDPIVRQSVEHAMGIRIDYLERLMREAGVSRGEARPRSVLAYSTYLGHATIAATAPSVLPASAAQRRWTRAAMLDLAIPPRPAQSAARPRNRSSSSRLNA